MLDALARLLGLSRTDAEASLYSERAARHVLTRRSVFGLAGAMCAGTVLVTLQLEINRQVKLITGPDWLTLNREPE